MRGLTRGSTEPSWADVNVEALKLELRERVAAIAEREAELASWSEELERRETRLERQREALRRRRLRVVKRLLRLSGRGPVPVAAQNGDEPALDEKLESLVAETAVKESEAEESVADEPASRPGPRLPAGSRRKTKSPPDTA